MTSIRLSKDIQEIAKQIAQARGLDNERAAIEAVVRCHWQDYLGGTAQPNQIASPPAAIAQPEPEIDGFSALDSLL